MSTPITDAEIKTLKSCKSENEWDRACDALKNARGGAYPSDWWAKVKLSGLMDQVLSGFGASSEIGYQVY